MVSRLPGWERRLGEYIRDRRMMPFAWGENDCCTFSAEWVRLATGDAPFPDLRRHRSAFAATRALVNAGCGNATDIARKVLGDPLDRVTFAQRGDIVSVDVAKGKPSLGICLGQFCAFPGENGLQFVLLTSVNAAWRV